MRHASGLIAVHLDVDARHEDEFNAWYDTEHLAQCVALEGFVRARRYFCPQPPLRYLAWYETVDEHVEPGPHFQSIVAHPTPWSQRMRGLYGERRERVNYRLVHEVGPFPRDDAPRLCLIRAPAPRAEAASVAARLDEQTGALLARCTAMTRIRRYMAVSGDPHMLIAIELAREEPGGEANVTRALEALETGMAAPGRGLSRRVYRLRLPTIAHA